MFYAGRAFQEYLVMAYAEMENRRLGYMQSDSGQKKLRAEQYDQLLEATRDPAAGTIGRRIVLPSTYSGSPRDMNARYQDAMAIVRHYGKVKPACMSPYVYMTAQFLPNLHDIRIMC